MKFVQVKIIFAEHWRTVISVHRELISGLYSADLSDSTLSYTESEAASSPNITPGEFSGGSGFQLSLASK